MFQSEVGKDRANIRRDTDKFLDGLANNTSNYSTLEKLSLSSVLGTFPSEFGDFLSGAYTAILPLSIAMSDRDNNRLEFTMLINPNSMNHGKTTTANNAYTRQGFVNQLWGPNQDLITGTGVSAAFMTTEAGLTTLGRRQSFAYANVLALIYAYRVNGYKLLDPMDLKQNLTRVISVVHGVELIYDGQVFLGHFNNFTLDESAEKPFAFDYNFEFVCSSLSGDYSEIRGHFEPIKPSNLISDLNKKLVNKV